MKLADKLDAQAANGRIIPDWRHAWKKHSVWVSGVGFVFTSAAGALSATGTVNWIAAAIFLAAIIGRLLTQAR